MDDEKQQLQKRIQALEAEVKAREEDLTFFRQQLVEANSKLEVLISELNRDLKLIHQVHRALVPTEFPNIPGFEFSTKFLPSPISGGDYFDIFEHQDKFRYGILLSSASGHSMSALLLSVLLKISSQMEAKKGADAAKALTKMVTEIVSEIQEDDSAHLFYAVVDRRSFEMNWAMAGHPMALRQKASDGTIERLESDTPEVTKDFEAKIEKRKLSLNSRDRVILCSRGILEVKNLQGEAFGFERLLRSVQSGPKNGVHELRNHLLHELEQFSAGQELPRDVVVIVIEVKDRVIKLAKE